MFDCWRVPQTIVVSRGFTDKFEALDGGVPTIGFEMMTGYRVAVECGIQNRRPLHGLKNVLQMATLEMIHYGTTWYQPLSG